MNEIERIEEEEKQADSSKMVYKIKHIILENLKQQEVLVMISKKFINMNMANDE